MQLVGSLRTAVPRCSGKTCVFLILRSTQQHHQILVVAESPTNDDGSLSSNPSHFFVLFTIFLQPFSALAFLPSFTFALEAFCASVHTFILSLCSSQTIKAFTLQLLRGRSKVSSHVSSFPLQ
jgi:hypothetical protein